jgi:hypothetical protein
MNAAIASNMRKIHVTFADSLSARLQNANKLFLKSIEATDQDISAILGMHKNNVKISMIYGTDSSHNGTELNSHQKKLLVSPFRKRLCRVQSNPVPSPTNKASAILESRYIREVRAAVVEGLTVQPTRINEKDIVLAMRKRLTKALALDPSTFSEFSLADDVLGNDKDVGAQTVLSKQRMKRSASTSGGSPAKVLKLSNTLATVSKGVIAKTKKSRDKTKGVLEKALSIQLNILRHVFPNRPWGTCNAKAAAEAMEQAAHDKYPFASAKTSIIHSSNYKQLYRTGMYNICQVVLQANTKNQQSILAKNLLLYNASRAKALGMHSPKWVARHMLNTKIMFSQSLSTQNQ